MKRSPRFLARPRTQRLWAEACKHLPGGVNSPVRAFGAVGGIPVFPAEGEGAWIRDEDGRRYLDFVGSWGPLLLGHRPPEVLSALQRQLKRGLTFGMPTALEVELAAEVKKLYPSIAKLRMTSSGTEACMSALRLARGFTGRDLVIKFEGCYHGHSDGLLVAAGSGLATFGHPSSAGVPRGYAENTLVLPYNDVPALRTAFRRFIRRIAAVIVEPVVGNMGVVLPEFGYLETLRKITRASRSLLIFDEVITGFRLAPGGAQQIYRIVPDLTVLGKILGGGLPVGAYGGRANVMAHLSPEGKVYQAGTLSGNPAAMATGLATLRLLRTPGLYRRLDRTAAALAQGLALAARAAGVPCQVNRAGSLLTCFFTETPVRDWATASRSDTKRYAAFFHGMLEEGVYLPPSQYEALFVSAAHGEREIAFALRAALRVMKGLA